jgi:uncharacterized membrane protein HdeD (DUF308 family)
MSIQSNVAGAISNWWWFLVKGLLFVVAGVAVLSRPLEGYVGLSILFSVCILGIGVVQIIFSLGSRPHFSGWGWTLVSGIIDLVIGFYLLLFPLVTMATLPFILGFWLTFRSFYIMGAAMDLANNKVAGWGWVFAGGVILLIFSGLVLYYPAAAAVGIIAWSGAAFLVAGLVSIVIGFKLRRIKGAVKSFA